MQSTSTLSQQCLGRLAAHCGDMFGDRILEALQMSGRDRSWLAKSIGISDSAVTLVINGQSKAMSAANTARAARALGVSFLWLATGEGPMIDKPAPIWREVAFNLAATMDAAERSQHYRQFVGYVDQMVERGALAADAMAGQQH